VICASLSDDEIRAALHVSGGAQPTFLANTIWGANASDFFESCSIKATGFSTVANFEGRIRGSFANRMAARKASGLDAASNCP